jgi:hypothetical protein
VRAAKLASLKLNTLEPDDAEAESLGSLVTATLYIVAAICGVWRDADAREFPSSDPDHPLHILVIRFGDSCSKRIHTARDIVFANDIVTVVSHVLAYSRTAVDQVYWTGLRCLALDTLMLLVNGPPDTQACLLDAQDLVEMLVTDFLGWTPVVVANLARMRDEPGEGAANALHQEFSTQLRVVRVLGAAMADFAPMQERFVELGGAIRLMAVIFWVVEFEHLMRPGTTEAPTPSSQHPAVLPLQYDLADDVCETPTARPVPIDVNVARAGVRLRAPVIPQTMASASGLLDTLFASLMAMLLDRDRRLVTAHSLHQVLLDLFEPSIAASVHNTRVRTLGTPLAHAAVLELVVKTIVVRPSNAAVWSKLDVWKVLVSPAFRAVTAADDARPYAGLLATYVDSIALFVTAVEKRVDPTLVRHFWEHHVTDVTAARALLGMLRVAPPSFRKVLRRQIRESTSADYFLSLAVQHAQATHCLSLYAAVLNDPQGILPSLLLHSDQLVSWYADPNLAPLAHHLALLDMFVAPSDASHTEHAVTVPLTVTQTVNNDIVHAVEAPDSLAARLQSLYIAYLSLLFQPDAVAQPMDTSHLLQGIQHLVLHAPAARVLLRSGGVFVKVTTCLQVDEPSAELCVEVIRTVTTLIAGSSVCRTAFADEVGYDSLQSAIELVCRSDAASGGGRRYLPVQVMDALFEMVTEASCPLDTAVARPSITNMDAVMLMWKLSPHFDPATDRIRMCDEFTVLAQSSTLNRALCCARHLPYEILSLLPNCSAEGGPALVEAALRVVECLSSHCVSVRELKKLFSLLRSGEGGERPPWWLPLCRTLQRMAQRRREGPSLLFEFSGINSSLVLASPVRRWPSSSGWSVAVWMRVERLGHPSSLTESQVNVLRRRDSPVSSTLLAKHKSLHDAGRRAHEPRILSFLNQQGERVSGIEVVIRRGGHIGIDSLTLASKERESQLRQVTFSSYTVTPGRWFYLTLTHSNSERIPWAKSEVRLFIDGVPVDRQPMRYTTYPRLNRCVLGANARHTGSAVQSHIHRFAGQMGAFTIFDSCLDTSEVARMAALGPDLAASFGDVSSDADMAVLASRLWLTYHPQATLKGVLLLDQSDSNSRRRDLAAHAAVDAVEDADCANDDLPWYRAGHDRRTAVNLRVRPGTLVEEEAVDGVFCPRNALRPYGAPVERERVNEDDASNRASIVAVAARRRAALDAFVGHVESCVVRDLRDILPCVGGLQVLFPLLGQLSGRGATPEHATHVISLFQHVLQDSAESQRSMVAHSGFLLMGHLLRLASPVLITPTIMESFAQMLLSLDEAAEFRDVLLHDALLYLYFDLRLWVHTSDEVQRIHADRLEHAWCGATDDFKQSMFSLRHICDALRYFYYDERAVSNKATVYPVARWDAAKSSHGVVIGRRIAGEGLDHVRTVLLNLMVVAVVECESVTESMVCVVVDHLLAVANSGLAAPSLECACRIGQDERVGKQFLEVLATIGGFPVLLVLLNDTNEEARAVCMRLITMVLSHPPARAACAQLGSRSATSRLWPRKWGEIVRPGTLNRFFNLARNNIFGSVAGGASSTSGSGRDSGRGGPRGPDMPNPPLGWSLGADVQLSNETSPAVDDTVALAASGAASSSTLAPPGGSGASRRSRVGTAAPRPDADGAAAAPIPTNYHHDSSTSELFGEVLRVLRRHPVGPRTFEALNLMAVGEVQDRQANDARTVPADARPLEWPAVVPIIAELLAGPIVSTDSQSLARAKAMQDLYLLLTRSEENVACLLHYAAATDASWQLWLLPLFFVTNITDLDKVSVSSSGGESPLPLELELGLNIFKVIILHQVRHTVGGWRALDQTLGLAVATHGHLSARGKVPTNVPVLSVRRFSTMLIGRVVSDLKNETGSAARRLSMNRRNSDAVMPSRQTSLFSQLTGVGGLVHDNLVHLALLVDEWLHYDIVAVQREMDGLSTGRATVDAAGGSGDDEAAQAATSVSADDAAASNSGDVSDSDRRATPSPTQGRVSPAPVRPGPASPKSISVGSVLASVLSNTTSSVSSYLGTAVSGRDRKRSLMPLEIDSQLVEPQPVSQPEEAHVALDLLVMLGNLGLLAQMKRVQGGSAVSGAPIGLRNAAIRLTVELLQQYVWGDKPARTRTLCTMLASLAVSDATEVFVESPEDFRTALSSLQSPVFFGAVSRDLVLSDNDPGMPFLFAYDVVVQLRDVLVEGSRTVHADNRAHVEALAEGMTRALLLCEELKTPTITESSRIGAVTAVHLWEAGVSVGDMRPMTRDVWRGTRKSLAPVAGSVRRCDEAQDGRLAVQRLRSVVAECRTRVEHEASEWDKDEYARALSVGIDMAGAADSPDRLGAVSCTLHKMSFDAITVAQLGHAQYVFSESVRRSIIAPFLAQRETRRAFTSLPLLYSDQTHEASLLWNALQRSLTNERAPWVHGETADSSLRWMLDPTENRSRERRKMKRNYAFNSYDGCAQDATVHVADDVAEPPVEFVQLSSVTVTDITQEEVRVGDETDADGDRATADIDETRGSLQLSSQGNGDDDGTARDGAGDESDDEDDGFVLASAHEGAAAHGDTDPADMRRSAEPEDDMMSHVRGGTSEAKGKLLLTVNCSLILPMRVVPGSFKLFSRSVVFEEARERASDDADAAEGWTLTAAGDTSTGSEANEDVSLDLLELSQMHMRRHLLRHVALELFLADSSNHLFAFGTEKDRKQVYRGLVNLRPRNLVYADSRSPAEIFKTSQFTEQWQAGLISNFDYLMQLNTIAGRTFNDLTQYPVFPWVVADYESDELDLSDPKTFRDLSKPMGALEPTRAEYFRERYSAFESPDIPKFHYGSHYSLAGSVLHYMMRVEPYTKGAIDLQGGVFDKADRLFHSVPQTWSNCLTSTSDVKELIPEFYYLPEMFRNENRFVFGTKQNGVPVDDVVLPPWAKGSSDVFVRKMRDALESPYVSQHLHEWIDLIFGWKQRGRAAVESLNVFYFLTYEGAVDVDGITDEGDRAAVLAQIENFGQTPSQLLTRPHPPRTAVASPLQSVLTVFPAVDLYSINVSVEPILFVGVPRTSLASFLYPSVTDRLVTVDGEGVTACHRWLANAPSSSGTPFTFEHDPLLNTRRRLGMMNTPLLGPGLLATAAGARYLISGGHWDNSVRVTAVETGKTVQSLYCHRDMVTCVSMAGDGRMVATGSNDTTVVISRVAHGPNASSGGSSVPPTTPTVGGTLAPGSAALLGGDRGASDTSSSTFIGTVPVQTLHGHDTEIVCVQLVTEMDLCISASADGTIILHTIRDGTLTRALRLPNGAVPTRICASQTTGSFVVYSRSDLKLRLYTVNASLIAQHKLKQPLSDMILSTASSLLAVASASSGAIRIFDAKNLEVKERIAGKVPVRCLAFAADESNLVAGRDDGKIVVIARQGADDAK